MTDLPPDWPLLERFLAGECSPAEVERVRRWLDEHPKSAAVLDALREAIDRRVPPEAASPVWDVERAWSRLAETTREDEEAGARYRLPPPLRRAEASEPAGTSAPAGTPASAGTSAPDRKPLDLGRALRPAASPWLRAAAAVLVLVGGGAGIALWRAIGGVPSQAPVAAPRVVTTQRAERADLRLADGTHVILAPESRLTIPADFDRARREVALEGEGYFEVVHDSTKPFLVRAAHGLVHDLGTRFTVRAYRGDPAVRVVVAEGRVVVGAARPQSALPLSGPVLVRGDLARLDTAGTTTVTSRVDVDRYLSWTDGRLVFRATPLRDAARELSRWYDVEIEIADSAVARRRLTLTLRDEPLAQVLGAVALVTRARYERDGRVVRFFASPSPSPTTTSTTRAP